MNPVPIDRLRAAARAMLDRRPVALRADAVEKVEEGLRADTPESVAAALAIGSEMATIATADLGPLAGRFLVTGHPALARALVDEAECRGTGDLTRRQRARLAHLREWTHPTDVPPPPTGAVRLGVFDYRSPDRRRASKNVGDYVQTLALLGNLARFTDVDFTGANGLGGLAAELQARVRPDLRIESPPHRAHLVPVSRDFSAGDPIPDDTWLVAFGWHMHSAYLLRFGLPYHPALRPLFLSFHLHNLHGLDEATLAYLRKHGPVGCRDWTTVDLLLSAGVDAFFTGCLTTTVDGVFPPLASLDRSGVGTVGVIDLPEEVGRHLDQPVVLMHNGDRRLKDLDLVSGTRVALGVLEDYQQRLDRIITGRLHAYLPATSLGLEVDFRPKIPGDARFAGLTGLRPGSPELDRMRNNLRDLLDDTLGRVLAGGPTDEVYAAWRARTAPLVAEARARHSAPAPSYPAVSGERVCRRSFAAPTREPATDVAMVIEADALARLPEAVDTVTAATPGPLRIWVVSRGLGPELPELPVTYLDLEHVPSAGDLLLLPVLLPEVSRLVVLDLDEAPVDVVRLAGLDLEGQAVAASTSAQPAAGVWRRAADRLPPEPAAELRRLMSARHPFAVRAIEPGPLVLDRARMRADDALADCLALAAEFGLDGREALLAYAGHHVAPLTPEVERRS
jgi:hypothetical protein